MCSHVVTFLSCSLGIMAINLTCQRRLHRPFLFSDAPHVSSVVPPQITHTVRPHSVGKQGLENNVPVNWYGRNLANHAKPSNAGKHQMCPSRAVA